MLSTHIHKQLLTHKRTHSHKKALSLTHTARTDRHSHSPTKLSCRERDHRPAVVLVGGDGVLGASQHPGAEPV